MIYINEGQEEFQAMRDEWIRDGDGYLLVYSVDSENSFDNLFEIRERILQTNDVQSAPIVIAGNKCDLVEDREVAKEDLEQLAKDWKCPVFETSAKSKINNLECFYQVVREIKKYHVDELPDGENHGNGNNINIECNCKQCCIIL